MVLACVHLRSNRRIEIIEMHFLQGRLSQMYSGCNHDLIILTIKKWCVHTVGFSVFRLGVV